MSKELKALNDIKKYYDAFYIENKYGNNTHNEEFDLLEKYFKDSNRRKIYVGRSFFCNLPT